MSGLGVGAGLALTELAAVIGGASPSGRGWGGVLAPCGRLNLA